MPESHTFWSSEDCIHERQSRYHCHESQLQLPSNEKKTEGYNLKWVQDDEP